MLKNSPYLLNDPCIILDNTSFYLVRKMCPINFSLFPSAHYSGAGPDYNIHKLNQIYPSWFVEYTACFSWLTNKEKNPF